MKEIKKVNIFSVAKILALFGILSGFLLAYQAIVVSYQAPISFSDIPAYIQQNPSVAPIAILVAFGWWSIIIAPVFSAAIQYITGLVLGLLYNWFARMIGGIKIDLN